MESGGGGGGGQCAACRFRGEENLARYSPWSCGAIGPCLSPFDPHKPAPSCTEHPVRPRRVSGARGGLALPQRLCFLPQELDGNTAGGGGGGGEKRWLHSMDHYRRLKDEDPIIPFSEAPIISKWGAISRAARAGYHAADPIQAAACQGAAADPDPHLDHRWSSRGSDSSSHSSFLERCVQPCSRDNAVFRTRPLRPPCRSVLSEHLCASERRRASLSSGEITAAQMSYSRDGGGDIELELCALDLEETGAQVLARGGRGSG